MCPAPAASIGPGVGSNVGPVGESEQPVKAPASDVTPRARSEALGWSASSRYQSHPLPWPQTKIIRESPPVPPAPSVTSTLMEKSELGTVKLNCVPVPWGEPFTYH